MPVLGWKIIDHATVGGTSHYCASAKRKQERKNIRRKSYGQ